MAKISLEDHYNTVDLAVSGDGGLPEHYIYALTEIHELMAPLVADDISEWVSREYRREWQRKQGGERDAPLCRCQSRRCRLKTGTLPYQLRRRSSRYAQRQTPEQQLRDFLKRHPEAVVIDEALDNLRERKDEVKRRLSMLEFCIDAYDEEAGDDPLPEWMLPDEDSEVMTSDRVVPLEADPEVAASGD